ncbi:MAG: signal peptide peptidase SppA [Alphaproteobacteria bacterium]|nr:signal peptide peptidase SppA [Alphaproteobacteria bacterium]MCW5744357.1 signal peptide peptidase SppA [Alphaproteobacteria bacterium]
MRRFIVGLLAIIGFITILGVGGLVLLGSVMGDSRPAISDRTVLKLDWRRLPGEEGAGGGGLFGPRGATLAQTVDALRHAAADQRVIGLVATLSGGGPGIASVQELREAIAFFRAAGKFAIVYTESFDTGPGGLRNWYLASAFEQIWLQPSGDFGVVGIAAQVPFLKDGLDRLGVRFEGGKRLEFKSAPNTFLESGFTTAHRENLQALVDGLFGQVIEDVARSRNLPADELRRLIDTAPLAPSDALSARLVDKLGYRDEVMAEIERRAGRKDALYEFADYLGDSDVRARRGEAIAVVTVDGAIVSTDEGASPLTGGRLAVADRLARAIDEAAGEAEIKAIVVRIDSPGGSYPASDTIRRAIERARQKGKPVVVSFGDVAASGGYFAALPADVIVAQRGTITGSIGVFGLKPVVGDLLDSLGIRVETIHAGANAAMNSPTNGYTPLQQAAVDRVLDRIYADFTRKVGDARRLDATRLDAAARGRVFTGTDAKAAGLVDELGGLTLAIAFAKAKAGIDAARETHVRRYPAPKGRIEQILELLTGRRAEMAARGEMRRVTTEISRRLGDLPLTWQAEAMRLPPLPPLWD